MQVSGKCRIFKELPTCTTSYTHGFVIIAVRNAVRSHADILVAREARKVVMKVCLSRSDSFPRQILINNDIAYVKQCLICIQPSNLCRQPLIHKPVSPKAQGHDMFSGHRQSLCQVFASYHSPLQDMT